VSHQSCSCPNAFEAAIEDGFGDVFDRDGVGVGEIGDCARDARDAVERAGRELAFGAGRREQRHRTLVQGAVAAHRVGLDIGITRDGGSGEAGELAFARRDDACANCGRVLAAIAPHHVVERNARDLDLYVDAIEQRPGELVHILCHHRIVAATLGVARATVAARAGSRCPFAIRPAAPESGEAEDN